MWRIRRRTEIVTVVGSGNRGFGARMNWTKKGGILEVCGTLFLDTWLQPQYMLDGQDFYLKLSLNDPKFVLHCQTTDTTQYKIKVLDCKLDLRHVQVAPDVILGHQTGLQTRNAIWTYNGHKLYTKLIKSGGYEDVSNDVFSGVYPKACIIGLVDHEAALWTFSQEPIQFPTLWCQLCWSYCEWIPPVRKPHDSKF